MNDGNNTENPEKVSEQTEEKRFQTNYFKASDKERVNSLIGRLEPNIREEDKPILEEIKKIIFADVDIAKPKTYILTGNIVEIQRQKVKSKEVTYPSGKVYKISEERQNSFFYRIKIDVQNNQFHYVWCFNDHLDEPTDWWKLEKMVTGDKYELEVDKNKSSNFKLRSLTKL